MRPSSHHAQRILLAAAMTRVLARRVRGFDVDDALENIEDLALASAREVEEPGEEPLVAIPLQTLVALAERCATVASMPEAVHRDPVLVDACRTMLDLLVHEVNTRSSEAHLSPL